MIKSNFFNTFQKKIDKLDIETIKKIIYQLIEENDNYKTIFNSMKEAVLVLDNNLRLSFFNKIAVIMLNINIKNPIGKSINELLENNEILLNIILATIKKEEKLNDYEIFLNNNIKYVSLSIHPLVQSGKIIGNIILMNDITKEIENKSRLRQAESLAALTTISAGIAHEIKNPLGAIGIHIQLIEDELKNKKYDFSDDYLFSVKVIKEEINRLNNIVLDYLFTVRPLKAELILQNLKIFLDDFINFIKPELDSKNIKIHKKYTDLPSVWLDEKYFKQALLNLIKNAIAAIKENGNIEIEAFQEHNYVILNIKDDGGGIPEDIQHKIFDPYFTTKNFGTGLGLTIVYKIIKEHRGEISFNTKNGYTVFTIKLPLSYIEKGQIEYSGE